MLQHKVDAPGASGHDLTVFIVDDDASVRDALGLLLGVRGYRTAVFASGEAFLQGWQAGWRGCLLIDIRMSGMDGLTLQQELNGRGCGIPDCGVSQAQGAVDATGRDGCQAGNGVLRVPARTEADRRPDL